jgi:hypothetical protein
MDDKQAKLFREEILLALQDGPKNASKIHGIIKTKYPQYCVDTKRSYGKIKWKHDVSNLLNLMQKEFLIYLDPSTKEWKLVE